jgi:hypothetical protein
MIKKPSRLEWYAALLGVAVSATAFAQQPTIVAQPQSSDAAIGTGIALTVSAFNPGAPAVFPTVHSGALKLWLKADTGLVTTATGQVSEWMDQSGNANNAFQTASNQQPSLIITTNASAVYPTVFFNGLQDPTYGDYLQGTGDLGLHNAYTSFMVYDEADPGTVFDRGVADVGIPQQGGADRANLLREGSMWFSAWGLDWGTGFQVPTNTTRLWTTRLDTNLDQIEEFDTDGSVSNYFPISAAGYTLNPPGAGYYIGGLGAQIRNYHGSVAELVYFQGYLTESDRGAVQQYFAQKYFSGGSMSGLTYQWQIDNANIPGATNATLTLADLQFTNAGSYSVIVSNSSGSITSSNAVLTVGAAPSITVQPTNQEVASGANVAFSASVSGTAPLSLQWNLNGSALPQATNSTLSLTNVGAANAGIYSLSITSPFGSATSSNATLSVDLLPAIYSQPQNESVAVSGSATFSVGDGLPSITSGTLALWLNAGAGVITNSSGFVTRWQDMSGNTNDAVQPNTNQQPWLATASGLNGAPVVRFNGLHDGIHGSYLHGVGDVGLSGALTSFALYMATNAEVQGFVWMAGQPPTFGAVRGDAFKYEEMVFSTWGIGYFAPFLVPTNVYSIWNDRVNTNVTEEEMYETSATNSTNFSFAMSGALAVAPGYYIGGIDPSIEYSQPYYNLPGDIAEVIIYRGYLSEADRLAVQHYLQGKYFGAAYASSGSGNYTYQWQLDSVNIANATNASLSITNVQSTNAGTYTVIVTDAAGSVTSSNAVLTVGYGPGFSLEPASQSVVAGLNATFNATTSGTGPDSYQWTFNGAAIAGATNSSLTLSNVPTSDAGTYTVSVTSPFGSAVSSNAVLTVLVPTLQVGSASTSGGTTVTVPVQLIAVGTEAGLGFSLDFDPTVLTFLSADLGSNASGSLLLVNSNQVASGHLGIAIDLTTAPSLGTNEVANVTFQVAVLTNATSTPITFGGQPTPQEISDGQGTPLLSTYIPGTVSIAKAVLEGDVWPLPLGDGLVTISDWVEEGRLVAGLDTTTNAGELQRADCAPRSTGGDGELTVADWVQVGRYAAGLDPLTAVGFPPGETSVRRAPVKTAAPRAIAIVPMTKGGLTNTVAVQLTAQGGENSLGFSVSFDPAAARFVNAALGSGATGAVLFQNTAQAANGHLGFVLGYNLQGTPTSFAAGIQQIVRLSFASVSYSNNVALNFGNTPVICDLVDVNADSLPATYQNVLLPVGGASWPALNANHSGGQVTLAWPTSAGFVLESASSVAGPWTPVTALPSTNGGSLNFIVPTTSSGQTFYRLQQQ